jgi:GntR family uxuAB operon transcriptional repressor
MNSRFTPPDDSETSSETRTDRDRAYQRLATQFLGLIGEGEFLPGERLPSERALAERFDVSRTSVREAIIALEIQGAVEVRGGSGIYVSASPPSNVIHPLLQISGPGPFEILRARCLIESEIAASAAETRKDADLDRIFAALADMRKHMDDKAANEAADRRFHLHIAESTGNDILLQVVKAMWDQSQGPVWEKIEQHFHTPELRIASQNDHQLIFNALVSRDAIAARSAMKAHLERVIQEFTEVWR